MKTITLDQVHKILTDCSAVVGHGPDLPDCLIYPNLVDLEGEDDNTFMLLDWTKDEGHHYGTRFNNEENQSVKIVGSSMFLIDYEGDEYQLTILCPENLEK